MSGALEQQLLHSAGADELPARIDSRAPFLSEAPLDILLVEDVSSDALLMRLALDAAHVPYKLRMIGRGDEVLPWLHHESKKGHHLPDVMVLDLGLPRMDGFEVLADMAVDHAALRAIPVIILTGYEHFEYVSKSYNLWIPAYIPKPCDVQHLRSALASVRHNRRPR